MNIVLHRVYDPELLGNEKRALRILRILVDRMWPRGIAKAAATWDVWLKDIAPSAALRQWFAHDREKWQEFQQRYTAELDAAPAAVAELQRLCKDHDTVVFLYAAKDQDCNNAVVLKAYLESLPLRQAPPGP